MKKEMNSAYTIQLSNDRGEVIIADEVIAVITGLAAMEVEGVASMAGNATKELISKLGIKSLSKGVSVEVRDNVVVIDATVNLKYGYNIKAVSQKVQEKIKMAGRLRSDDIEVLQEVQRNTGMAIKAIDAISECSRSRN